MMTATKKLRAIRNGCFGVRYYAEGTHKKDGYIFNDSITAHDALGAIDEYVRFHELYDVLFVVVNDRGEEVELFSIEE